MQIFIAVFTSYSITSFRSLAREQLGLLRLAQREVSQLPSEIVTFLRASVTVQVRNLFSACVLSSSQYPAGIRNHLFVIILF